VWFARTYCVEELRFSDDAAAKRIQAARAARRFPALFEALADGRLHLTAVCLLAPHLVTENVGELIEAATHQRKSDIEVLLGRRYPAPSTGSTVRPVAATPAGDGLHAPAHADGFRVPSEAGASSMTLDGFAEADAVSKAKSVEHAPAHVHVSSVELVPEHYDVHMTISGVTHAKLRRAQDLLSHAVPTGEVSEVFDRALDTLLAHLETTKLGSARKSAATGDACSAPRHPKRNRSKTSRYISAHVRRRVWERDHGQCTFVGSKGRRCASRRFLEFDHVVPVAQGGSASVDGLRLRCRAHNQLEAERAFGADFMRRKREEARAEARKRAEARARTMAQEGARAEEERARAHAEARARVKERTEEIVAGLRSLGCRGPEARRAAEHAQALEVAAIEEQMRAALSFVSRRARTARRGDGYRTDPASAAVRVPHELGSVVDHEPFRRASLLEHEPIPR
jgi:5-methylcytosine-specific restriction endonuclease McrA